MRWGEQVGIALAPASGAVMLNFLVLPLEPRLRPSLLTENLGNTEADFVAATLYIKAAIVGIAAGLIERRL